MNKQRILSLVLVLVMSLMLTACGETQPSSAGNSQPSSQSTEKQGDTTLTGKISGSAGAYFITVTGQQPKPIDSYGVELSEYVGKTVTITGQYSGDTLFVGKVK
jgi:outer membrane biogenesis lipoprotein LolB